MIIKSPVTIDNHIITFKSGHQYIYESLIQAIEDYNHNKCPHRCGILNRKHIMHVGKITHIVHRLFIEKAPTTNLCADIEMLDRTFNINSINIKPIIVTPLQFGSGVTKISAVKYIQIEF